MKAVRLASTKDMPREEWLSLRRIGIGGSDMAAISGVNPWRSAVDVYLDKLGQIPDQEDNDPMRFGRKLESIVADEFAERTGHTIRRVNAILQHPEQPHLLANIDRLVFEGGKESAVLEIKTSGAWAKQQWEEGPPDYVKVQAYHYLGVTGLDMAYIAALVGGNAYFQYELPRDDELIEYLQEIAREFISRLENKTPPSMDGSTSSSNILNLLYPSSNPGSQIELPEVADLLVLEYERASIEIKELEERKDQAANQLKQMLGEAEVGLVGEKKITWKTVTSSRLDSKRLKADHPDLYRQYSQESSSRRFTIGKRK